MESQRLWRKVFVKHMGFACGLKGWINGDSEDGEYEEVTVMCAR